MTPTIEITSFSHLEKNQKDVIEFLDKTIRPTSHYSVIQEYPSLFKDLPGGLSYCTKINDKMVSHVGTVVREFIGPTVRMKVGMIGSVATHPDHRKKGLASQLITQASNDLKKKGCSLVWLWASEPDFYYSLGFNRAGGEVDFRFAKELITQPMPAPIAFDSKKHLNQIWKLYQLHSLRIDRSLEEFKKISEIPNTRIFVTEKNQKVTSYIAINKGADFENYIHEWGGEQKDVLENIQSVQQHIFKEKNLTLIAPRTYDMKLIQENSLLFWKGVVGLCKVLDKKLLLRQYQEHLKAVGLHTKALDSVNITDDSKLLEFVFQSEQALPFFLWGFDSI
jgi:GNAT superfamily N-acetyltransferase